MSLNVAKLHGYSFYCFWVIKRKPTRGGRGIKLLPTKIKVKGRICQATHRHPKASNKYKKNYDKNIESSYIEYLDVNNLYGWTMSQKLPTNGFKWVEDLSEFNENFVTKYDKRVI